MKRLSIILTKLVVMILCFCMNNQLSSLLQQSGFTEKEAQVYLALLELGEGDVTEIATRAGLKRSIIYVLLEGLIKRGYATTLPNQRINRFAAVDPAKIFAHLSGLTKNFKEMLPLFRAMHNKSDTKPRINYFDTIEGVISVYREINEAPEAYFYSSIARLNKIIPDEVASWINGLSNNIYRHTGRHILENTSQDIKWGKQIKKYGQHVKLLAKGTPVEMDLSIYPDKVALTSLDGKLFIVVIESEALYTAMRQLFMLAWKSSLPLR